MVHSEGIELGCVCPECGARCKMCLGTDSVVPREALRQVAARFYTQAMSEEAGDEFESEQNEYGD